jgi:hypothetical protein
LDNGGKNILGPQARSCAACPCVGYPRDFQRQFLAEENARWRFIVDDGVLDAYPFVTQVIQDSFARDIFAYPTNPRDSMAEARCGNGNVNLSPYGEATEDTAAANRTVVLRSKADQGFANNQEISSWG